MNFFSYLHRKLLELFSGRQSPIITDLSTVFGERKTPVTDPNRGTTFWTAGGHRLKKRFFYLVLIAVIVAGVFIAKLWQLQLEQGQALAIESVQNTLSQTPLFTQRGTILDRNNKKLAWNVATSTHSYPLRSYATSSGIGHVLGYVSYPQKDSSGVFYRQQTVGQAGIEGNFQGMLAGQAGTKIIESNALGKTISESVIDRPQPGDDLQLSIDVNVQEQLHSLIERTAQERGFTAGAGVIMDVESGELLAATDYPEYDPQALTSGQSDYITQLTAEASQPFLNRISAGRFTPGSIIKPFVAVAALAEEVISPQTTIVSTGALRVENPYQPGTYSIFPDWKEHGPVAVRDALAFSSNEFFYQIGGGYKDQPGLGISRIADYSHAFGLGEETGIKGMTEVAGVIPTPEWKQANFQDDIWRLGDTYHTAIGQYGYQVTPLAMTRATAALATSGQLPTPTLVANNQTATETVAKNIDSSNYQVVREGMRRAVTKGTAGGLDVDYLSVAAKTGTAELGGDETGLNSWVIGFFPYEDPQYAFTVVMANGPRSNTVGGVYVMRQLLDWMQRNNSQYFTENE